MINQIFYNSRLKALRQREAKDYYVLCTHLSIKPEDDLLYKRGEEIVETLRLSKLEKMLPLKQKTNI